MKKRVLSFILTALIATGTGITPIAGATLTDPVFVSTNDEAVPKREISTETNTSTTPSENNIKPTEEKAVEQRSATETNVRAVSDEAKEEENTLDTVEWYMDTTPYIRQGDSNGDGTIDSTDVTIILRYLNGEKTDLDKATMLYGDVNSNNDLDIFDAVMIQRYLAGKISYFELITRKEEMPLYLQYQGAWSDYPYGDGTIANSGCGPTSIAMTATYLSGSTVTPDNVAAFLTSEENGGRYGHYIPGAGMTHDVWELCAKHYDFIYVKKANGIDEAYEALRNGQVVISSQGHGLFTSSGHFIVLSGLWSDGTIQVNDPNDNNTQKNYKNTHFTKEAIAKSGYCYYVFDSYDSVNAPEGEAEFIQAFNTYFKKAGYSKAAICGILGNIYAECGMQSRWYFAENAPDAGGASGNSGGVCMWYGDNCTRFKRDCPDWNEDVTSQFKYLAGTLDNNGQGAENAQYYYQCSGAKAAIQSVPDTKEGAQQAAHLFMMYYERPSLKFDQSIRWQKATEYWELLN